MGRPRKRRTDALTGTVPSPPGALPNGFAVLQTLGGSDAQPEVPPADASFDFFGHDGSSNITFLDLLPNDFYGDGGDNLYGLPWYGQVPVRSPAERQPFDGSPLQTQSAEALVFQAANFVELESSADVKTRSASDSWQRFVASPRLWPPEESPWPASSDMSTAVESPPSTAVRAMPSTSCGCLSSLYLATESLGNLPPEVHSVLRVAKAACKVAQEVVECRHCFDAFVNDPLKPPPIQSFQNLMSLGSLVPSACNAYASILGMVDRETAAALAKTQTLFFKDVGGVWATDVDGDGPCSALHRLSDKYLEPDVWRLTIRVIVRLDVYGLGDVPGSAPPCRRLKGIKDTLARLDEKARRRHEIVDEIVVNGCAPRHPRYLLSPSNQPCPPKQRSCVRIIETARTALNRLTIS